LSLPGVITIAIYQKQNEAYTCSSHSVSLGVLYLTP
jgi:hypothetical protein